MRNVIFLCAPSYRSRAYAQAMCAHKLLPSHAIYLGGNEPSWDGVKKIQPSFLNFEFKPNESALETLQNAGVNITKLQTQDVNSKLVINEISKMDASVIVYSGPAGAILGKPILNLGKKFLHVHGGNVPNYRGSTAFYYSILSEGTIGASAIYLDEKIDQGPLIRQKTYIPEPAIEIDRILDPLVRADTLIDVLSSISIGQIPKGEKQPKGGVTYQVIHPVLKHIALNKTSNI